MQRCRVEYFQNIIRDNISSEVKMYSQQIFTDFKKKF
jgi:hypothetical protein